MNLITSALASSPAQPLPSLLLLAAIDLLTMILATKLFKRAKVILFEEVAVIAPANNHHNINRW
jgi:hypothetical protein